MYCRQLEVEMMNHFADLSSLLVHLLPVTLSDSSLYPAVYGVNSSVPNFFDAPESSLTLS